MSERRFTNKPDLAPTDVRGLPIGHEALKQNRTLFPSTVVEVTEKEPGRLLVSGRNNRKLGATVEKGRFKGYGLYGLSLEERATCPSDCAVRDICYGNGMQMARRHRIGDPDVFFDRLGFEIAGLLDEHTAGVLVRLHVLGDFPSVEYAAFWKDALDEHPKLAVYGYTARRPKREGGDDIGDAVEALKRAHPARFRIRWSSAKVKPDGAIVIDHAPPSLPKNQIVCPAQTDATACCSTCALCWEPAMQDRTILFLKHGPKSNEKAAETVNKAGELTEDDRYDLEERIKQLQGVLTDDTWIPSEWGLTTSESIVVNVLTKRALASKAAIHTALYGQDSDGGPDEKIVDVFICRIRDKLAPIGIEIETQHGNGFRLSPASFAMLDAMRRGEPPPMPGEPLGSALSRMDVRPIIPVALSANMKPNKLTIDRPSVRMARIADMRIERAYQRDISNKSISLIRKIVTAWDWAKYKPPICAECEDGGLVVIDGQHTAIAAASHPGISAIPVLVVEARSIEKRAQSFVSHNRDRIAMSALQLFHAMVASGDDSAQAILRIVIEENATVPRQALKKGAAAAGEIMAITAVQRLYSAHGPDTLRRAISIAVLSRIAPISSTVIYALKEILTAPVFADVAGTDNATIATAMTRIHAFEKQAQSHAVLIGQNRYWAAAALIADAFRQERVPDATAA